MKKNITSFSAVVQLPKEYDNKEVTVDIEISKDEEHLTYDEVEDAMEDIPEDDGVEITDDFDDDDTDDIEEGIEEETDEE